MARPIAITDHATLLTGDALQAYRDCIDYIGAMDRVGKSVQGGGVKLAPKSYQALVKTIVNIASSVPGQFTCRGYVVSAYGTTAKRKAKPRTITAEGLPMVVGG